MSQAGSGVGASKMGSKVGSKAGSKGGGSHFSNTSSFHQSAMAMTGDSQTLPPGGIKHPQRFQSYVGPKREPVSLGSQSNKWVEDRIKARPVCVNLPCWSQPGYCESAQGRCGVGVLNDARGLSAGCRAE
jgi:hypothetical protein